MRLNNCFYLRSTVIIGPFVFLVIGLNLYIGTNKDLFFSSALKKKKTNQGALCSTTEITGFKTFLKLFCSEIISA